MITTRSRTSRAAVATLALAGVIGLSACQGETTVSGASPSAPATTTSAPTTEAPSTTESAPSTTESSESESSSSSSSESTAAPSAPVGDTAIAAQGTKLKFGQAANVKESTQSPTADAYRLNVKSLDVAPDSIFTQNPKLNKADGTVYFLRYDVTNIGKANGKFDAGSVNGFMLVPDFGSGQKGKKMIGGTVPECDTDSSKDLAVGATGSGCDIYQVTGATVTSVAWRPGLYTQVTWNK